MSGPNRLYHNDGDGTFTDVAADAGRRRADLQLRLLVLGLRQRRPARPLRQRTSARRSRGRRRRPPRPARPRRSRPGSIATSARGGFRDVTAEVGLDRVVAADGLATSATSTTTASSTSTSAPGGTSYSYLVPNVMFQNVGGRRFEDVTDVLGDRPPPEGARRLVRRLGRRRRPRPLRRGRRRRPGDRGHNVLFQNPGARPPLAEGQARRHAGPTARPRGAGSRPRSGGPTARRRSIYRTVGNNSSFGGNSLVGPPRARPGRGNRGAARSPGRSAARARYSTNVRADQTIEVVEGRADHRPLAGHAIARPGK